MPGSLELLGLSPSPNQDAHRDVNGNFRLPLMAEAITSAKILAAV